MPNGHGMVPVRSRTSRPLRALAAVLLVVASTAFGVLVDSPSSQAAAITFNMDGPAFGGTSTTRTTGAETLTITAGGGGSPAFQIDSVENLLAPMNNVSGNVVYVQGMFDGTLSLNLSVQGGKRFDLVGLSVHNWGSAGDFAVTTSKGSAAFTPKGPSDPRVGPLVLGCGCAAGRHLGDDRPPGRAAHRHRP